MFFSFGPIYSLLHNMLMLKSLSLYLISTPTSSSSTFLLCCILLRVWKCETCVPSSKSVCVCAFSCGRVGEGEREREGKEGYHVEHSPFYLVCSHTNARSHVGTQQHRLSLCLFHNSPFHVGSHGHEERVCSCARVCVCVWFYHTHIYNKKLSW